MKLAFVFSLLAAALFYCVETSSGGHKIVAYWGQNAVYNQLKQREYWEKELPEFCKNYNYDIVVLSFLNVFFETRNKDEMPGFNFAFHCETPVTPEYPKMFRCPLIEEGIKECQKRGKKVLMSLGGAVGKAGFYNSSQAQVFAYRVYHLLLEGTDLMNIRPFGSAILNGIDLDIENGPFKHYDVFVKELRRLEASGKQKYLIGAAPQCPFPDRLLGPSSKRVLGIVPHLVDEIYIQFYNNWCHTGNTKVFEHHMKLWLDFAKNYGKPMIFIGVPSNKKASGNAAHYRTPSELVPIYNKYKNEPLFGGFMFWDASFDQNNVIENKHYSEHIKAMYLNTGPEVTGKPITLPPFTGKTYPTVTTVTKKVTNPPIVTVPSTVSCNGLPDGIYADPKECNRFFQCSQGQDYQKECPSGLRFNSQKLICDWPRNVICPGT